MILGFMQKFPWGGSTDFDFKILSPFIKEFSKYTPKIHTIRVGQRWKPGMKIHMARGVRTKEYKQFNIAIPELQEVKSVQRIDIIHRGPGCLIIFIDRKIFYSQLLAKTSKELTRSFKMNDIEITEAQKQAIIPRKVYNRNGFLRLLENDGITEQQFWKYFGKFGNLRNGQIIHWTDLKY